VRSPPLFTRCSETPGEPITAKPIPLKKAIAFSAILTVGFLLALEGGLRLYAYVRAEWMRGKGLPPPGERSAYQVSDPVLGYALKPGYNAKGISINTLGFRGPEIAPEKPRGTTRIFAIGDSTTFGLSGENCPYPEQLQRLLDNQYGLGRFEVINAGVEGYGTDYALRLLETRIVPLKPDLVLVYVGWNDLYSTSPYNPRQPALEDLHPENREGGDWKARIAEALDSLYIARWLKKLIFLDLYSIVAKVRGKFAGGNHELAHTIRFDEGVPSGWSVGAQQVGISILPGQEGLRIVTSGSERQLVSSVFPSDQGGMVELRYRLLEGKAKLLVIDAESRNVVVEEALPTRHKRWKNRRVYFRSRGQPIQIALASFPGNDGGQSVVDIRHLKLYRADLEQFRVSPHFTAYYRVRLKHIIETVHQAGAKPVLLTLPTLLGERMSERGIKMLHYPRATWGDRMLFLDLYRRFDHALRETAEQEGVPLIDIAGHIDRLDKDALFFDSLHMHCEGYGEIANYILSELARRDLISSSR
jgi:lysophospholipase L1-like esterase